MRVVISTTSAALTFEVPLALTNAESGLLPSADQALIRVTLTGPLPLLAGVSASNIVAVVDLAGLNAGEHTLEVDVTAPSGLIAILVPPSEVIVNLTAQ